MPPKKSAQAEGAKKNFKWTPGESALLIDVAIAYKTAKMDSGLDWETCKNKLKDMATRMIESYPKPGSDFDPIEFPNVENPEIITAEKLGQKLKRIKGRYREAIDSGRESGGGRVVYALYEKCTILWGGSPAVDSHPCGFETVDLSHLEDPSTPLSTMLQVANETTQQSNRNTDGTESDVYSSSQLDDSSEGSAPAESSQTDDTNSNSNDTLNSSASSSTSSTSNNRRSLLNQLKDKRDSRLTKRVSSDSQILDMMRTDLECKKKYMENQEQEDKWHRDNMEKFTNNLQTLTDVISHGFTMLQTMIQQQHSSQDK